MLSADIGANSESLKVAAYPGFDWLRIVLASIVVLGHEGVSFPRPIDGGLAVEVFFALSGWLIGGILLKTDRFELPRFFFNRVTRIWIPYAFSVVLLYGFALAYQGFSAFWVKYLFYDATFTHEIFTHFPRASQEMPLGGSGNQFWSISVEEQFYLIAPVVMLLAFGKKLITWAAIAFFLMAGGVMGVPLALGVVAALLRRDHGDWHLTPKVRPFVMGVTLVILGVLSAVNAGALRPFLAVGVVLSLAVPGTRQRLPVFLGGISYPVYLNHWIGAFVAHGITRRVLHVTEGTEATTALVVAIAYPVSLIVGAISYWLVDRPVLTRRDTWFAPSRGVACGAAAYSLVLIGLLGGTLIG